MVVYRDMEFMGQASSEGEKCIDAMLHVCHRLMQNVQMHLTQLKNQIDVIVPEQEVLTESLEEVTFMHFTAELCHVFNSSIVNIGIIKSLFCCVLFICELNTVTSMGTASVHKVCIYDT